MSVADVRVVELGTKGLTTCIDAVIAVVHIIIIIIITVVMVTADAGDAIPLTHD